MSDMLPALQGTVAHQRSDDVAYRRARKEPEGFPGGCGGGALATGPGGRGIDPPRGNMRRNS
jgi:hypothetical protein